MKIRTAKYIIKEGFVNSYKNTLMSLASVSIVAASLIMFGFFFLIVINVNANIATLTSHPEIDVFCDIAIKDEQVAEVQKKINENTLVKTSKIITRKQALEEAKKIIGEKPGLASELDEKDFFVTFEVKLKDPDDVELAVDQLNAINGVDEAVYSEDFLGIITKVANWINVISFLLTVILIVISVFIISNTIKLTVFARRREINIMKFIGATDWFIRWPFIVEGVIIGLVGASISFLVVGYTYNALSQKVSTDFSNMMEGSYHLVPISSLAVPIVLFFIIIGITVGSIGSFISIRKHLHV